jgi:hypothetical protein
MKMDMTCSECGRVFDLLDNDDASEWYFGHDCEDTDEAGADEVAMLQDLIDRGIWGLEGSMGRAMMAAIEDGRCTLGPAPARDYWGNYIPSRTEVEPGTKGSVEYAAKMREAS